MGTQPVTLRDAGEEIPAIEELEHFLHCLKSMPMPPNKISAWVKNLRGLITKILCSPPGRLADVYRKTSFELIQELFKLLDCSWLEGDQQLLSLVAHLATAEIRILLDNPAKIDCEQFTVCCSIEEECIRSIEDEEQFVLDEATATAMSITCREAVVFVTDYWGQSKESEDGLPLEVEMVMYRLVCVFLSIGGAGIMNKDNLKKICPHLIKICWMAVEQEDFGVARQLISVLQELPVLESTVLKMLTIFVKTSGVDRKEALALVESVVDILKDRVDWYDKESLQEAVKFAKEEQYTDLGHFIAMMIVLSDVHMPTEGVRLSQPQVEAFFDTQSAGEGTLCVSESCVTWISRQSQKGISLSYKSIILHATSSDLSSFPREHIYVLVDCSKAERPKRAVPLYTAEEARHIENLNMHEEEMNGEDANDADSEDAPSVQIRFVPIDTSCLQQIYDAMAECQELNPEEDDMSEQEEEEDFEAGGDVMPAGQWYTADNLGDNFELSEEGIANLQRMMGGGGDQHHQDNGHHNGAVDENMDDS